MKLAYLIMAHTAPTHLRLLVDALRHPDAVTFLHIDAKADQTQFQSLGASDVRFIPDADRVKVHWGDYSQVEAIFVLMRAALAAPERFDRLVLISGVDLPLRPAAELTAFFEERPSTEFISLVQIPNIAASKTEDRLTDRWYRPTLADKITRRLVRLHLLPRKRDYRPAFNGLKPFGGSTWWALTRACCEEVVNQLDRRPALVSFLKGTSCADETLIHTLVGNSAFAPNVTRSLTYTRWRPGAANPDVLGPADMPALLASPEFPASNVYGPGPVVFARKFAEATSAQALEVMNVFFASQTAESAPTDATLQAGPAVA